MDDGQQAQRVSMDPIHRAWHNYGRPAPGDKPRQTVEGLCCRCGTVSVGYAALGGTKAAVSDGFSDWDRLPYRERGSNFCQACAWVFCTRQLRQHAQLVAHDAVYACRLVPAQLRDVLTRPLADAVSVPIGMQKHVMPWMRWGHVATDHAVLPWGQIEAARLGIYLGLHRLGFGPAALAEPAPRFDVLAKLDPGDRDMALTVWGDLDPWRQSQPYLDVAARCVRKPKQDNNPEEGS